MYAADQIARTLNAEGIRYLFGMIGTQNVTLFDAFRRANLQVVTATSELAAGFMAIGAARTSGRPALLCVIPGPGLLYLMPAIGEASLDSVPLVILTLQSQRAGRPAFDHQAVDQATLLRPLVRAHTILEQFDAVETTLTDSLRLAAGNEPGPVVIEIAPSLLQGERANAVHVEQGRQTAKDSGLERFADSVHQRLQASSRPLFLMGGGAIQAAAPLLRCVEQVGALVIATGSGRGIVSEQHHQVLSADPAVTSPAFLNTLTTQADLIVVWGAKLSYNGTAGFAINLPAEKLIRIDQSDRVLAANYPASDSICGDCLTVASRLAELQQTAQQAAFSWDANVLRQQALNARTVCAGDLPRLTDHPSASIADLFTQLRSNLPDDAVITTDSGYHQLLVRTFWQVRKPATLLMPTDMQSMGYAIPAAIGAEKAVGRSPVIACVGDGGFGISGMELLTAVREQLPIVVIVFHDGQLGLIRRQQIAATGHPFAAEVTSPDFERLADSFGVPYQRYSESNSATIWSDLMKQQQTTLVELRLGDSSSFRAKAAAARLSKSASSSLPDPIRRLLKKLLGR